MLSIRKKSFKYAWGKCVGVSVESFYFLMFLQLLTVVRSCVNPTPFCFFTLHHFMLFNYFLNFLLPYVSLQIKIVMNIL